MSEPKRSTEREKDIARLRAIADRVFGPNSLSRAQLETLLTEIEAATEETLDKLEAEHS